MIKVTTFMLCDAINNVTLPNGSVVPQLSAPTAILRPQFIPGSFSFGVAIGLLGVNIHQENKIKFAIVDPDGVTIQNSGESSIPAFTDEDNLPADWQGFAMSIDVRNLVIQKSGIYTLKFYINDEEVCAKEFPVFEAKK